MYSFLSTLEWLLCLLLVLFHWLEPSVQYWREVLTVNILVLFLILGESIQFLPLSKILTVHLFIDALFLVQKTFLLFQVCWEVFSVLLFSRAEMDVGCVKCFFYSYQGSYMVFVNMLIYIDSFLNVQPSSNTSRNVKVPLGHAVLSFLHIIWFAKILLRIVHISIVFSSCDISLWLSG